MEKRNDTPIVSARLLYGRLARIIAVLIIGASAGAFCVQIASVAGSNVGRYIQEASACR